MQPGKIVESYQGLFAKVIRVTDTGHTHLSSWVRTPELAEEETVSVIALNDFGLSQVLKGGHEGAADAEGAEKPLSKHTVAELKVIATELELPAEGTKAELIAAIDAKRAADAEGAE